jgi:hypothetical protein
VNGPLSAAAERLEAFARERLRAPGLVLGLVGPAGWRHELAIGVAEVASGRPLRADALMPVASIGKAMTAVALLREAQAGRVDHDAAAAGAGGELPAERAALVGTYAACNPWTPRVQVRAGRDGGGLELVWPWGEAEPLVALADGSFRVAEDPDGPEHVRFRAVVGGRPAQAVVSGWPFDRVE